MDLSIVSELLDNVSEFLSAIKPDVNSNELTSWNRICEICYLVYLRECKITNNRKPVGTFDASSQKTAIEVLRLLEMKAAYCHALCSTIVAKVSRSTIPKEDHVVAMGGISVANFLLGKCFATALRTISLHHCR